MQGGIVAVRLLLISSRLDAHLQMIYKNFRQHASMHMLSDFFFILGADWNQFNQACLLRSRGNMQRRALFSFPGWIIFVVCSENNTQQSEEVPLTMLPMYGSTPSQTTLILTINMFRLDCPAFRQEKFSIKFGLSEDVKICAPKR